jgi:hypothetical protein
MKRVLAGLAAAFLFFSAALAEGVGVELSRATTIDPIQPPSELIERIERRAPVDGSGDDVIVVDHLPYFAYYSLHDDAGHVVHPMRLGAFLRQQAASEHASDHLEAALDIAFELPNGGLAWYYPRHYRVNRMLGDKLKYSAISQGTLIAGLGAMAAENDNIESAFARQAFRALLWPFERGGVNFADLAILEMPSFAGPPENILNGWIDALLHIRDFAELYNDDEALQVFRRNVEFLVATLPNFDDREAGLSRYSDLSPYRARVTLSRPDDVEMLEVLYRPLVDGLPAIRVPLERVSDPASFSVYENRILRQNGRTAFVWLSCSQLYETVLISRSDSMIAEIDAGTINRRQSTPGYGGQRITLESVIDGDFRYVRLAPDEGLICGYPTNFSHGDENRYHTYHIVGLLLLALGDHVEGPQRAVMIEWALRWLDDVELIGQEEGLAFREPQVWLDLINRSQLKPSEQSFQALLTSAREMIAVPD